MHFEGCNKSSLDSLKILWPGHYAEDSKNLSLSLKPHQKTSLSTLCILISIFFEKATVEGKYTFPYVSFMAPFIYCKERR